MAAALGRWLVGTRYRDILGADDPPGATPLGDFITAGPGNDYMIADTGADVFGFNRGDGYDYINDFVSGEDKLQFGGGLGAASLVIRQEALNGIAGLSVYYPGRMAEMSSVFLADVAALRPGDLVFEDLPGRVFDPPPRDVDNDLKTDVVLQPAGGPVTLWSMNGAVIGRETPIGNPGGTWSLAGIGDFNANWKQDLLLRDQSGALQAWFLQDGNLVSSVALPTPGPAWDVAGIGHFDDDPAADILFQHEAGPVVLWLMGGWQRPDGEIAAGAVVADPGPAWRIVATGDFNGDFKADILLRHQDGSLAQWQMNGTGIAAGAVLGRLEAGATVAATGDLDGNGTDDILLRQADGALSAWFMDGTTITAAAPIANPGIAWNVLGLGDYDGNDKADILLRATDGSVGVWLMDGARVTDGRVIANRGTEWELV